MVTAQVQGHFYTHLNAWMVSQNTQQKHTMECHVKFSNSGALHTPLWGRGIHAFCCATLWGGGKDIRITLLRVPWPILGAHHSNTLHSENCPFISRLNFLVHHPTKRNCPFYSLTAGFSQMSLGKDCVKHVLKVKIYNTNRFTHIRILCWLFQRTPICFHSFQYLYIAFLVDSRWFTPAG